MTLVTLELVQVMFWFVLAVQDSPPLGAVNVIVPVGSLEHMDNFVTNASELPFWLVSKAPLVTGYPDELVYPVT